MNNNPMVIPEYDQCEFACNARKKCGVDDCSEADPHKPNQYCKLSYCGEIGKDCFCEPVPDGDSHV
jgi:hypothetical protein